MRARKDQGRHTSGHTGESGPTVVPGTTGQPVEGERVYGATRRDRTGDLLITKFQVWRDLVDSALGAMAAISANSA